MQEEKSVDFMYIWTAMTLLSRYITKNQICQPACGSQLIGFILWWPSVSIVPHFSLDQRAGRHLPQKSATFINFDTWGGFTFTIFYKNISFQQLWSLKVFQILFCPSLIKEVNLTKGELKTVSWLPLSLELSAFIASYSASWWFHPLLSSPFFCSFPAA